MSLAEPIPFPIAPGRGNSGPFRSAAARLKTLATTTDPVLLDERQGRWGLRWAVIGTVLAMVGFLLVNFVIAFAIGFIEGFRGVPLFAEGAPVDAQKWLDYLGLGLGFSIPVMLLARLHGRSWTFAFRYARPFLWEHFWKAAAPTFVAMLALTIVDGAAPNPIDADLLWLVPLAVAIVLLQTLGEELAFHGYLVRVWGAVVPNRILVCAVVSAIFVAGHLVHDAATNLFVAIFHSLTQITVLWMLFRTRSLAGTWGMHFGHNLVALIVVPALFASQAKAVAINGLADVVVISGFAVLMAGAWSAVIVSLVAWPRSFFYIAPAASAAALPGGMETAEDAAPARTGATATPELAFA